MAERLAQPPGEERRPKRPEPDRLIGEFSTGADHLVDVLRGADPTAACWTWAPAQQNVAFVLRHQVQEAAVHRWDAEHAIGRDVEFGAAMSVDAIEEFLTVSVSSAADHPATVMPSLAGSLVLAATDADATWTVTDGTLPGTVEFSHGGAGAGLPTVSATASRLLLWLYGRAQLPVAATDEPGARQLLQRLRALSFTD